MNHFGRITEPEELDFYTINSTQDGKKEIHILGFTSHGDDWKGSEVCGLTEPLEEFIQHVNENKDYVNETYSEHKQYEEDYSEEEIVNYINSYFNGKPASYRLPFSEITLDTPCGNYVH